MSEGVAQSTAAAMSRAQPGSILRRALGPALELAAILGWALFVGRESLDLDPARWLHGADLGFSIESLYQWDLLLECGPCVLWNGYFNGGAPAFLETHAPFLHPLIIALTLLYDPHTASRLVVVLSLAAAGLAQWWLARVLRLGPTARLWSALLAVTGGHLTARLEAGLVWMIFANASAALVLAPLLRLVLHGRRRDGVVTALLLALALLAGQGYAQAALLIALPTVCGVFVLRLPPGPRRAWTELARLAALTVLLTGVLWLPLVNHLPFLHKDLDLELELAQAPERIALDFVVSDPGYYREQGPGRVPFPGVTAHFIGWTPVALFVLGALRARGKGGARLRLALLLPPLAIAFAASRLLPDLIGRPVPAILGALRHPTLMLGVAVPFILGLAALQLDELLGWGSRTLARVGAGGRLRYLLAVAAAVAVLAISLPAPYRFSRHWAGTFEGPAAEAEAADRMLTPTSAWTQPPGESYWGALLAERGQKATGVFRPWWLEGAPEPPASLVAARASTNPSLTFDRVINGIGIYARPEVHYAALESGGRALACAALARGGRIVVSCPESGPGVLTVLERNLPGWRAACSGAPAALSEGPWLAVPDVRGPLLCEFTYFSWDVPAGLALTLLGVWAAVTEWRRSGGVSPV